MQIGLSIHPEWIKGDWNLLEQELNAVSAAGADTCELVLHGLDVVIGDRILEEREGTLKKLLRKYPLAYTLHVPYELDLTDSELGELYRKVMEQSVILAKNIECSVVVYHAGNAKEEGYSEDREVEIVRNILRQAETVKVCMENGPYYPEHSLSPGRSAQAMCRFAGKVDHGQFGLTFDVGHAFLNNSGNGEQLLEELATAMPYIAHIHLHDNMGIPCTDSGFTDSHKITCGMGDIHLPLGWGKIPLDAVLTQLKEGDYPGIINLEIEKRFEKYYKTCVECCRSVL